MRFLQINTQRKKTGFVSPRKFVSKVRSENELFGSFMHQDAHEFFNYLLNDVSETLARQGAKQNAAPMPKTIGGGGSQIRARTPSLQALHDQQRQETRAPIRTWVDEIFQGRLVNETKCLFCESVTSREEPFYDLSLEIEQNCSVTACLRCFSSTEILDGDDKFSCDACGCKQEAEKRMSIAALPPVLCLHLKRFKYVEQLDQLRKLTHRVVFPFHLKVSNTTDDCPDADAEYALSAVVVHMGAHVNHGHYVALVKSAGQWICFDDEQVHGVTEAQVQSTFGHTQEPVARPDGQGPHAVHMDHGYILMYQKVDDGPSGEEQHWPSRSHFGGEGKAHGVGAAAMQS